MSVVPPNDPEAIVLSSTDTDAVTVQIGRDLGVMSIISWYNNGPRVGMPAGVWLVDPERGVYLDRDEATRLLPALTRFLAWEGPPT